jgi:aromatic-L-amino-acid/L-tryptophan decarboxylase
MGSHEFLDDFRSAGHRIVDQLADLLTTIEDRPLRRPIEPAAVHALFDEPVPQEPSPLGDVLDALDEKLLPYCTHVNHPGYFGLITPSPLPAGILGDLLASGLNQNVGAWSIGPSAVALERRVVRWLCDLAGYERAAAAGTTAGGNLTSGGMSANFIGLKLARDAVSGDRAQHGGVEGRWAVYTSEERHVSVDKAVDAVGWGRKGLRVLPTDDRFRLRLDALEGAIAADRRQGVRPAAIVGMAGSTNNGAVDALPALREIADREGMWLHLDAAYGGGMLLSRENAGTLAGLERADSITIDPHKWFYAPLDAGAILVRDETRLTRSFGLQPSYLVDPRDPANERYNYYVHGFEQSRRFRGLKVWMGLKRHGARQIGEWVDANVRQARRLHELAEAHPDFTPATYPAMSAICIRYAPGGLDEKHLASLHAEVAGRIEDAGRFWISTTELKGRAYFRINPVNWRTRMEHVEELFATLVRECSAAAGR